MTKAFSITAVILLAACRIHAQERVGFSLVAAQSASAEKVTATGRVVALASARVGARVSGHIIEWGKDERGEALDAGSTVKAGQALFKLNPTTYANSQAAAQAMLNSAQAALANLTARTREERIDQFKATLAELDARITDKARDEQRFRRLVEEEKTMPARRLEEVQTELAALKAQRTGAAARLKEAETGPTKTEIAMAEARAKEAEAALKTATDDLRDTTVKAPYDGLITKRYKSLGDYVSNMPLVEVLELVATDKLEAEMRLSESYFTAVATGSTQVTIKSSLLPRDLTLPITRIVNEVDPAKGTFVIRVAIPADQKARIVPGAFVTADVFVEAGNLGVIVPQRAVVTLAGKTAVFVAEQGKVKKREVELGDALTEGVVVKSGLRGREKVLVGPVEKLKDGDPLPADAQERN